MQVPGSWEDGGAGGCGAATVGGTGSGEMVVTLFLVFTPDDSVGHAQDKTAAHLVLVP